MSGEAEHRNKPAKAVSKAALPPQTSPNDTSNWDDRAFSTPKVSSSLKDTQKKKRQRREFVMKPLPKRERGKLIKLDDLPESERAIVEQAFREGKDSVTISQKDVEPKD